MNSSRILNMINKLEKLDDSKLNLIEEAVEQCLAVNNLENFKKIKNKNIINEIIKNQSIDSIHIK